MFLKEFKDFFLFLKEPVQKCDHNFLKFASYACSMQWKNLVKMFVGLLATIMTVGNIKLRQRKQQQHNKRQNLAVATAVQQLDYFIIQPKQLFSAVVQHICGTY